MKYRNIVMVAGGTGGHIYPALALASALKKSGANITFMGANNRLEKELIPLHDYPFIGLDIISTSGNLKMKVKSLFSMVDAYFKIKKILIDMNIDLVIGFGNYISVPVILAAKNCHIKTVIHEQNSFAGRANLFLDHKVDLVIGSYEENKKQFKNKNTVILGNPQSSMAADTAIDKDYLTKLGLKNNKKTLLIFFGSLGSESLNKAVLDFFKIKNKGYQIIYAAGKNVYPLAQDYSNDDIKIIELVDGVQAMLNADLLLSRAGATTIAEIAAVGIASILIPSPYVPNNHQYYNAKTLSDFKAAILLEEKDLSGVKIKEVVEKLIFDDGQLNSLAKQAKLLANPKVIDDIIDRLEKL